MTTQTKTTWQQMKFKDFADTSPSVKLERGKEYPFIPMDVVDGQNKFPIKIKSKKFTGGGSKFANGDTIFARITPCLENGKIAKIKDLKEGVGFGSTEFFVFRGKNGISDSEFVYYLSRTDMIRNPAIKSMVGASGRQRADKSVVENLDVLAPSLADQCRISDVLSTYDNLIENNTRRIQILEQMARAVYTEWFGSPESNWEIVPLRDALKSYIGGGWGKEELDKKYSDPAYVIRGTDIPKASVGDVSTCPLRYHTPSNLKTRVLQGGDLVFEVSGGSKGQPVGRSLLVTSKFLNQFNQNIICASFCKLIRPDQDKISPFQLYEQILSWYANSIIEKYQVQSTGISNFRFESFIDEEKVALPPREVRDKFDGTVSPLFDEVCLLGNQSQNLRQTRDLLLPKLVSGEIEVSPI